MYRKKQSNSLQLQYKGNARPIHASIKVISAKSWSIYTISESYIDCIFHHWLGYVRQYSILFFFFVFLFFLSVWNTQIISCIGLSRLHGAQLVFLLNFGL